MGIEAVDEFLETKSLMISIADARPQKQLHSALSRLIAA